MEVPPRQYLLKEDARALLRTETLARIPSDQVEAAGTIFEALEVEIAKILPPPLPRLVPRLSVAESVPLRAPEPDSGVQLQGIAPVKAAVRPPPEANPLLGFNPNKRSLEDGADGGAAKKQDVEEKSVAEHNNGIKKKVVPLLLTLFSPSADSRPPHDGPHTRP